jgi:ABC-2 type transport system permease protein
MTGTFVRLKLRVLRNGFRGKTARKIMFGVSLFLGLWFGGFGCFVLISSFYPTYPELGALIPPLGGALLMLGWIFGPLVWFGVDETLNPSRFALLPLSRATLVRGLLAAALLGVPALATALAAAGLVIGAAIWHGAVTALITALGATLGVLTCVALSRSVTSAFSNLLGSRRVRDLAAICLALLAAMLGPLQLFGISALQNADFQQMEGFARIVGWTPLGAPWSAGVDASSGHWLAPLGKLAIAAAFLLLLVRWWMSTIETAMIGTVSEGGGRRSGSVTAPVARLFGRLTWFPVNRDGAMAVREARYWWRDTRRRASLLTFSVIGIFLPVVMNLGRSDVIKLPEGQQIGGGPLAQTFTLIGVGVLGGLGVANQFGFDGSAYAVHLTSGVPGKVEMRSRVLGYSVYIVPMLLVISVAITALTGRYDELPMRVGILFGSYGVGLGVCLLISVYGAYSLPETSNPFAVNTGAGLTKSLFAIGALSAAVAMTIPLALGALLVPGLWMWLSLPVGLAYGAAAIWLGIVIGGDALDRRGPELLAAIMPRD